MLTWGAKTHYTAATKK